MRSFSLRAPSPSMAVAMAALFVSLGGTGYAASQLDHSPAASVAKKSKKKKHPIAINDNGADTKLFNSLLPKAHVAFATDAGSASTAGSAATAANATNATHAMTADAATNATNAVNSTTATTAGVAKSLPALTWAPITLANGWKPYGGSFGGEPAYAKDAEGFVHLTGTLNGTSSTSLTIGTLPAGFRPSAGAWIPVGSSKGSFNPYPVNIWIQINGQMTLVNGEGANNAFVSLEGAEFYVG